MRQPRCNLRTVSPVHGRKAMPDARHRQTRLGNGRKIRPHSRRDEAGRTGTPVRENRRLDGGGSGAEAARRKEKNRLAAWKPEPVKETVDFPTYEKLDIRVGKVVECEKFPGRQAAPLPHRRRHGQTHHRKRHSEILQARRTRRKRGVLHSELRSPQAERRGLGRHDSVCPGLRRASGGDRPSGEKSPPAAPWADDA